MNGRNRRPRCGGREGVIYYFVTFSFLSAFLSWTSFAVWLVPRQIHVRAIPRKEQNTWRSRSHLAFLQGIMWDTPIQDVSIVTATMTATTIENWIVLSLFVLSVTGYVLYSGYIHRYSFWLLAWW
jgi:hypothetical protein